MAIYVFIDVDVTVIPNLNSRGNVICLCFGSCFWGQNWGPGKAQFCQRLTPCVNRLTFWNPSSPDKHTNKRQTTQTNNQPNKQTNNHTNKRV